MKLMTHVELNCLDYDFRFIVWNKWIHSHGEKLKFDFAQTVFSSTYFRYKSRIFVKTSIYGAVLTIGNY